MARPAIHPGEHLADELRALHMSATELAHRLHAPPNRVTGILHGDRDITADTALRLGHFFGTSPEFWLNLQSLYDLRRTEQHIGWRIRRLPTLQTA
jgi:antitoxin HigA-1